MNAATTPVHRLPVDDRFDAVLRFTGQHVRLVVAGAGTFTGWITSVAFLGHGTTSHVVILRTDPDRRDKDIGYSLAKIVNIEQCERGSA